MYTFFYHLLDRPFTAIPDPVFLWLGPQYAEALSALRQGLRKNQGLVLLTGEAGCGKTTLLNALTGSLDNTILWAVVSDPGLERLDFYNAIAKGFGIDRQFTSKVEFLLQFNAVLHKAHAEGKKAALLIDDCHRLSQDMLEELRLLANIEKEEERLVNILLAGRREFLATLKQPNNRALSQRLTLKIELVPFSPAETHAYIRHRLKVAGTKEELFTDKAIAVIHRAAQGIPRFINMICDQALHVGATAGNRLLDHELVAGCLGQLTLPPASRREEVDDAMQNQQPARSSSGFAALSSLISAGAAFARRLIPPGNPHRRWGRTVLGIVLIGGAALAFFLLPGHDRKTAPDDGRQVAQQSANREANRKVDSPAVGEGGKLEPIGKAIDLNMPAGRNQPVPQSGRGEGGQGPKAQKDEAPAAAQESENAASAPAAEPEAGETKSGGSPAPAAVRQAPEPVPAEKAGGKKADEKPSKPQPEPVKAPAAAPAKPRRVVLPLRANSLELTDEAAKDYRDFIDELKNHPKAKLLVKGFVSAKTNSPENIKLSEERAMGVQQLLVKSGIAPSRITVKGMGNQEPLAPNNTSEGRTKNRRVEVEVVGDGR